MRMCTLLIQKHWSVSLHVAQGLITFKSTLPSGMACVQVESTNTLRRCYFIISPRYNDLINCLSPCFVTCILHLLSCRDFSGGCVADVVERKILYSSQ